MGDQDREVRIHVVIDPADAKAGAAESVAAVDSIKTATVAAGAEGAAALSGATAAQEAFAAAAGAAAREILTDQSQLSAAEAETAQATRDATAALELEAAQAASDAQHIVDVADAHASLASTMSAAAAASEEQAAAMDAEATAATAAVSATKSIEQEFLAAGLNGAQLAAQLDRVKAAFDRVDTSTGIGVRRAVANASVEVDAFKAKVEAAEKAGVHFGPAVSESVNGMNTALAGGIDKAALAANALRKVGAEVDLASDAFRRGSLAGGSFRGMLMQMDMAAGGANMSIGKAALGFIAFEEAAKLGWRTGLEIDKWLIEHGVNIGNVTTKLILAAAGYSEFDSVLDHHGTLLVSSRTQHNDLERAITSNVAALKAMGVNVHGAEEALALATKQGKLFETVITEMVTRGDDLTVFAKDNSAVIVKWAKEYQDAGGKMALLSTALQNIILDAQHSTKAFGDAQIAHEKFVDSIGKAATAIQQNYQKETQAANASALAAQMSANAKMKALNDEVVSSDEYSKQKRKINDDLTAALLAAETKRQDATQKEEQATRDLKDKVDEHKGSLTELLKEYVQHELSMKAAAKSGGDLGKVQDALKTSTLGVKTPLSDLQIAVGKLGVDANTAVKPIGDIRDGLQQWEGPVTTLPNPLKEVASKTKDVGTNAADAVQPVNALGVGVQSLGQQAVTAAQGLERLNAAIRDGRAAAAEASQAGSGASSGGFFGGEGGGGSGDGAGSSDGGMG